MSVRLVLSEEARRGGGMELTVYDGRDKIAVCLLDETRCVRLAAQLAGFAARRAEARKYREEGG